MCGFYVYISNIQFQAALISKYSFRLRLCFPQAAQFNIVQYIASNCSNCMLQVQHLFARTPQLTCPWERGECLRVPGAPCVSLQQGMRVLLYFYTQKYIEIMVYFNIQHQFEIGYFYICESYFHILNIQLQAALISKYSFRLRLCFPQAA